MKPPVLHLVALAVLVSVPAPSQGRDWLLTADGTGDAATIQEAFDLASPNDRILLAPGVYRDQVTRSFVDFGSAVSTVTAIAFMAPGVSISSTGGATVTVLDGVQSHHCLIGTDLGAVEVSGISFVDARSGTGSNLTEKGGAGVAILRSDPDIHNNIFRNCVAPRLGIDGAGALLLVNGTALIHFNVFLDNFAGDLGGAIQVLQIPDVSMYNNTFAQNEAGDYGGAVVASNSIVAMSNNIFSGNVAANKSGALQCNNPATVITGGCNLFWNNSAPTTPDVGGTCTVLGLNDNIIADPEFCASGFDDFTISAGSPASPTDPSGCGLRGALPVGCGPISVQADSWGRIKAHYR